MRVGRYWPAFPAQLSASGRPTGLASSPWAQLLDGEVQSSAASEGQGVGSPFQGASSPISVATSWPTTARRSVTCLLPAVAALPASAATPTACRLSAPRCRCRRGRQHDAAARGASLAPSTPQSPWQRSGTSAGRGCIAIGTGPPLGPAPRGPANAQCVRWREGPARWINGTWQRRQRRRRRRPLARRLGLPHLRQPRQPRLAQEVSPL